MPFNTPPHLSRTLFVVRGKLGDTLAAWPSIRSYIDRHPQEEIWLAERRNYAFLLADEPGVRLLPFASSAALYFGVLRLRLSGGIARLAVAWGFGKAIARLARLSGARRRCYLDTRFPGLFTDIAPEQPNDYITDASWRVACLLDPELPRPQALYLGSLARRRQAAAPQAVCLVPVADEARRLLGHAALCDLAEAARQRFPDAPLWLLGNPQDVALQPLLAAGLPADVELKPFPQLEDLVDTLQHCHHLLTTDTGVYHLAAAMGVPATVFFGPTVPHKIVLPNQTAVDTVRFFSASQLHCEVKDCTRPRCLHLAVEQWTRSGRTIPLDNLPPGCLLNEGQTPCAS